MVILLCDAGVKGDALTPRTEWRVEKACQLVNSSPEDAEVISSGGKFSGSTMSAAWLMAEQVSDATNRSVYAENQAYDTYANITGCLRICHKYSLRPSRLGGIIIPTEPQHFLRFFISFLARGYIVRPAITRWWVSPTDFVKELVLFTIHLTDPYGIWNPLIKLNRAKRQA